MNNLEVGMYVRTDEGIRKILREYDEEYELNKSLHYLYPEGHNLYKKDLEEIAKASFNIIDLIEEQDFVQMEDRGDRFYEIEKNYTGKLSLRDIGWDEYEELDETNLPEIISIITHEQMERMKYKVE